VRSAARSETGRRTCLAALAALLSFCSTAQGGDPPGLTAPRDSEPVRILFIGNSYSFYNDLPDLLASQAVANQIQVQVRITARDQTKWAASFAGLFDRESRSAGGKTLLYATPSRKGDVTAQEAIDASYRRIAAEAVHEFAAGREP